jgi:hypothetical protein
LTLHVTNGDSTDDTLRQTGLAGWDALRARTPLAIEEFLGGDASALPFLAPALQRLLEELPDVESGLSRSERQVLELLSAQPRTPLELFLASQELEEAPFAGDGWFYRCVAGLGELIASPSGDLLVTDAGRAVLVGEADRVELLGIDRWLGGTHLTTDNCWRRDGARIVRGSAA